MEFSIYGDKPWLHAVVEAPMPPEVEKNKWYRVQSLELSLHTDGA